MSWQIPVLAAGAACCRKRLILVLFAYCDTFIGTRFIRYIFYAKSLGYKGKGITDYM